MSTPHSDDDLTKTEIREGQSWVDRVGLYVEHLDEITENIDLILDETRVNTLGVKGQQINESTVQLQVALAQLEEMVAKRDDLIRASDAPKDGTTLATKLKSTYRIEDARLAKRCQEVSEKIKTTHERALSLFVCQFHLAELTTDIMQTLSGSQRTNTYKKESGGSSQKPMGQGGLFDEAA